VLRARELFQAAGDNGEETEALDDVMYALHARGGRAQPSRQPWPAPAYPVLLL